MDQEQKKEKLNELMKKIKLVAQQKKRIQAENTVNALPSKHEPIPEYNEAEEEEYAQLLKKTIPPPRQIPKLDQWVLERQKCQVTNEAEENSAEVKKPQNTMMMEEQEEVEMQINCLIEQFNENLQEEPQNEDEIRQVIVNTIRNKKPPKHRKKFEDIPTPFDELSEPYQLIKNFADYFPTYKKRREKKFLNGQMVVDVGVKCIHQLLYECIASDIIPKKLINSYEHHKIEHELEFIKAFSSNKLQTFDFNQIYFTSLDHRELCQMLISRNPSKYTLGQKPFFVFKQVSDFYEAIYSMDQDQYNKINIIIRKKYNLHWWDEISRNFQENCEDYSDHNINTSVYFQPQPCPLFGATHDDPENDFEKAKNRLYPAKISKKVVKPTVNKESSESENSQESSHYENLLSDSESDNKYPKEEEELAEEKGMNSLMVSEFNSEIKKAFLAEDSDSEKSRSQKQKKPVKKVKKPATNKSKPKKNKPDIYHSESEINKKMSMNLSVSSMDISRISQFGHTSELKVPSNLEAQSSEYVQKSKQKKKNPPKRNKSSRPKKSGNK